MPAFGALSWLKGEIPEGAISNAELADMVQARIKGRASGAGTGDPTDLTASQVFDILGITAAAQTVLDDATVAAMVDTLFAAASTGSGGAVRATSPTLVTPTLGVAACTSINVGGGGAVSSLISNSFTPTITNVANVATSSNPTAAMIRLNSVAVTGFYVNIDPTSGATLTQFRKTLGVASNFTTFRQMYGVCASSEGNVGRIYGDTVNDEAQIDITATGTAAFDLYGVYVHRII